MIGLFALALLAGWSLISWFLVVMWKSLRPEGGKWPRRIHLLFGVVILGSWFGWSFWEVEGRKMYWDFRVWQMCQEDGGVTVYETVELPAERFDEWGNVGLKNKKYAKPSDGYYFQSKDDYLREENPRILRSITQIIRIMDGKVLGESIRYSRSGGGVPGPWFPSSYGCPPISELGLESSVFDKGV